MKGANRGKFIVIEGGEGVGKDTQIDLLKGKLKDHACEYVRDPGSTDIGSLLREIVMQNKNVSRTTELFLYLAARTQLIEERIKPALEAGKHVISNRFHLSTVAYQIYVRERKEMFPFVKSLSDYALRGVNPDALILLDCPPEVGLARARGRGDTDRFQEEELAFHHRVREGYHTHVREHPRHFVLDATRAVEEVHAGVMDIVLSLLAE